MQDLGCNTQLNSGSPITKTELLEYCDAHEKYTTIEATAKRREIEAIKGGFHIDFHVPSSTVSVTHLREPEVNPKTSNNGHHFKKVFAVYKKGLRGVAVSTSDN